MFGHRKTRQGISIKSAPVPPWIATICCVFPLGDWLMGYREIYISFLELKCPRSICNGVRRKTDEGREIRAWIVSETAVEQGNIVKLTCSLVSSWWVCKLLVLWPEAAQRFRTENTWICIMRVMSRLTRCEAYSTIFPIADIDRSVTSPFWDPLSPRKLIRSPCCHFMTLESRKSVVTSQGCRGWIIFRQTQTLYYRIIDHCNLDHNEMKWFECVDGPVWWFWNHFMSLHNITSTAACAQI